MQNTTLVCVTKPFKNEGTVYFIIHLSHLISLFPVFVQEKPFTLPMDITRRTHDRLHHKELRHDEYITQL